MAKQENIQCTNSFATNTWTEKSNSGTGQDFSVPSKNRATYTDKDEVDIKSKTIPDDVSVYDVATYILERIKRCSTMKLHKLLYYYQTWSLVQGGKSLFPEPIEAWTNGPVVHGFFDFHKGRYSVSYDNTTIGNGNKLSTNQRNTIDNVLRSYEDKPAQWLIDLTHTEVLWKSARKGYTSMGWGSTIITNDPVAEYHSSLF